MYAQYVLTTSCLNQTQTNKQNRSCGFDAVRFLDETDTHVVLSGLLPAAASPSDNPHYADEQEEEDRHACLVGLAAFVAANLDVLSVQMRARYGTVNEVASWIIQARLMCWCMSFQSNQRQSDCIQPLKHPPNTQPQPQHRAATTPRTRSRSGTWA